MGSKPEEIAERIRFEIDPCAKAVGISDRMAD